MNKYYKSLENIGLLRSYDEDGITENTLKDEYEEDFENLQELIDIYETLSKIMEIDKVVELAKEYKFDRSIFFNSKNVVVNGVSYEQLESAYDEACLNLSRIGDCHMFPCPLRERCKEASDNLEFIGCDKKETWKEYFLMKARNNGE